MGNEISQFSLKHKVKGWGEGGGGRALGWMASKRALRSGLQERGGGGGGGVRLGGGKFRRGGQICKALELRGS